MKHFIQFVDAIDHKRRPSIIHAGLPTYVSQFPNPPSISPHERLIAFFIRNGSIIRF